MKTVILYHANCMDGTGARYAAWKKFGDKAIYLAAQYGQPLPEFEKGPDVEVYMLDFSLDRKALESLRSLCKKVRVIDHHATAQEALQGDPDAFFDMSKSGAVLAWEEFHPNDPVPMLLQYIQDRDLWKFNLAFSKPVHAGLGLLKGNMEAWDHYVESDDIEPLVDAGDTILRHEESLVEGALKAVKIISFMDYKAGIINTGELISEKGAAICNDKTLNVDLAIMWFVTKKDEVVLSMRSKSGSEVDVGKLCKTFGGGGHKHAAGCKTDFETLKHILNSNWY